MRAFREESVVDTSDGLGVKLGLGFGEGKFTGCEAAEDGFMGYEIVFSETVEKFHCNQTAFGEAASIWAFYENSHI